MKPRDTSPRRPRSLLRIALLGIPLAVVVWTLLVAARIHQVGSQDDAAPSDANVVLGTAQYQGTPSLIFQARLDHAARLYEAGVAPLVVVAGGKLEGDRFTEASAGAGYLRERGVPEEALLLVGEGGNTLSSLRAVAAELRRRGLEDVVLVSDRFHMLRSLRMAADLGLRARGSPTTTSPVERRPASRARYTLREVAGYTAYLLTRL